MNLIKFLPLIFSCSLFAVPLLPTAPALAQVDARDYLKQGLTKLSAKNYTGAVEDFTQAIALNPRFADAYAFRCEAKTNLQDYVSAIADCNQALTLNPNSALAYFNRGDARADLEDVYGAIDDFTEVIRRNPDNKRILAEAYLRRGSSQFYLGYRVEGIQDVQQAATLFRQQGNTPDYQRATTVLSIFQRQVQQ